MDDVVVKLGPNDSHNRWRCFVCGGWTEGLSIVAEAKTARGTFRVCGWCLKAGDMDARLAEQVTSLEEWAAALRELIGRMRVPTSAEWATAKAAAEDQARLPDECLDELI